MSEQIEFVPLQTWHVPLTHWYPSQHGNVLSHAVPAPIRQQPPVTVLGIELLQHAAFVRESSGRPCGSRPPGVQHCRHVAGLPPCDSSHSPDATPPSHAQSLLLPTVPHKRWHEPPWHTRPRSHWSTPVAPDDVTHRPASGMSRAQSFKPAGRRGFTSVSVRQYEPEGHELGAAVQSPMRRRLVETQMLEPPTFVQARFSPQTPGEFDRHVGDGLHVCPSLRSGTHGKLNVPPHWNRIVPDGHAAIPQRSLDNGVGIGATPHAASISAPARALPQRSVFDETPSRSSPVSSRLVSDEFRRFMVQPLSTNA